MQATTPTSQTNPLNRNQTLYFEPTYHGLPVMECNGAMIEDYLQTLHRVIQQALADHPRIFAFRFDLRFPLGMDADDSSITNDVISRFIDSFKAKIKHNRACARMRDPYAHNTRVRYVWTRENNQDHRVHYHVVILLNRDAFFTLGNFSSERTNMATRVKEAWASALGLPVELTTGLVHFPDNPIYHFGAATPEAMAAFFRRASYLCKANTKQFGNGHHGFGASRQ